MALERHQFVLLFAGGFSIEAGLNEEDKAAAIAAKKAEILSAESVLMEVGTMELELGVLQLDDERKFGFNAS